jgi:hypothetical protein
MCQVANTGISKRFKWITGTLQTTLKRGGSLTMLSSNPWESELYIESKEHSNEKPARFSADRFLIG